MRNSKEKLVDTIGPVYVGSEGRQWVQENLFVEFDDTGVVQKTYFVSHHDLVREVSFWVTRTMPPALDVSQPIEIKAKIQTRGFSHKTRAEHGVVVLSADGLEMQSEDQNGHSLVRIRLDQVEAL